MYEILANTDNNRDAVYLVASGSQGITIRYGRRGTGLQEREVKKVWADSDMTTAFNNMVSAKLDRGYKLINTYPNLTLEGLKNGLNVAFKAPVNRSLARRIRSAIEGTGLKVDVLENMDGSLTFVESWILNSRPATPVTKLVVPVKGVVSGTQPVWYEAIEGQDLYPVLAVLIDQCEDAVLTGVKWSSERTTKDARHYILESGVSRWIKFLRDMETPSSRIPVLHPIDTGRPHRVGLVL